MHVDLEQPPASLATESDLCIVGAGIAGLLLAQRLGQRGLRVTLLEAGGLELEDRSQQLYQAEMASTRHAGATEGRFRTFGGSSTRWGGQLLPYTHDVFAPAPDAPSLAWPIDDRELAPYYAELQQMLGVDLLPFDASLLPALGHPALALSPGLRLRFSKWIPFARRSFARVPGQAVRAHPRVLLCTHANVAALEGESGRIVSARVLTYSGQQLRFRARTFLVATGAIESSRLLLLSPGVPNPHDQIGRYFHDHLSVAAAEFAGPARARILQLLGPFLHRGTLHTFKLEAESQLCAQHHLLAAMAHLTIAEPDDSGAAALRSLLRSLQRGHLREALVSNLPPLLGGLGDLVRLAWHARFHGRRSVSRRAVVRLHIDVEQQPTPENRIRLSTQLDALGLPRAVVDWRVGPRERATVARYAALVAAELERLGLAPTAWDPAVLAGDAPLADTFHPMGGARMGLDPAHSVVDPTLRVHGLENLYIVSTATYPAGGSSNPTFTLMALALRLADQLSPTPTS